MTARVLFVDDEPLMREFYSMIGGMLGEEFEISVVGSGREGLAFLEHTPVDIVVSDLVMPEMNGREFMSEVAQRHPESMRIVLSAYEDQLTVAQCLMFGHRYFSKPFDLKDLSGILRRICRLKHQVGGEMIKRVVSGLGALPTPPDVYFRLTKALDSDLASLDEITSIIEQDPGLTVKLLQIANSAYFGMARRVVTPAEAVQVVGFEVLRAVVLCLHAFKFYQTRTIRSFTPGQLWEHSIQTAYGARRLAAFERLPAVQCDETFVSALLHDIGKLVMAANADAEYQLVMRRSREEGRPAEQIEREVFGATHAQVGAFLLGLWGLPDPVVSNVEMHHDLRNLESKVFSPGLAIHIAQCLQPSTLAVNRLDTSYLEELGLQGRVPEWQRVLRN